MTFTQSGDFTAENVVASTLFVDTLKNRSTLGAPDFDLGSVTAEQLEVQEIVNKGYEKEYHVGATDMPHGRTFSTIQAAIDQAVLDGGNDSFANIIIHSGIYVENISLSRGISLRASVSCGGVYSFTVVLIGNILVDLNGVTADNYTLNIQGIQILGTIDTVANTAPALTGSGFMQISDCIFQVFDPNDAITLRGAYFLELNNSISFNFGGGYFIHAIDGAYLNMKDCQTVFFPTCVKTSGTNPFPLSFIFCYDSVMESLIEFWGLDVPKQPSFLIDSDNYSIELNNCNIQTSNITQTVSGIKVDNSVTDCKVFVKGSYINLTPDLGTNFAIEVPNVPGVVVYLDNQIFGSDLTKISAGNFRCFKGADPVVKCDTGSYEVLLSDLHTITALAAAPGSPVTNTIYVADGTTWDPAAKAGAVPYPVFYDGVAFIALY